MKSTDKQKDIGKRLGINVSQDSIRLAAAKIKDYVYTAIEPFKKGEFDPSGEQIEYAESLGLSINENDTRNTLSAKIADELEKKNIKAINEMNLQPGDTVLYKSHQQRVEEYTISSIGKNYRLWFKGGQGKGTWPSQLLKKTT